MASSIKPLISSFFLFFLFILVWSPYCIGARSMPPHASDMKAGTWSTMQSEWLESPKFTHAGTCSQMDSMSDLRNNLQQLACLVAGQAAASDFDDDSDAELEAAKYLTRLGLQDIRRIDPDTDADMVRVESLMASAHNMKHVNEHQHGSSSFANKTRLLHVTINFKFFNGMPKWDFENSTSMSLRYSFDPNHTIESLSQLEIRAAFAQAFATWAEAIPVKFMETSDYLTAQVKIGFYKGDHGDWNPFDGPRGVLGHASPPPGGELHLDADENWAVNFTTNHDPANAFDLESVAIHEIGHVLGLDHTPHRESVMYPTIHPMTKKDKLSIDDVEGIQMLYGPNPNFNPSSLAPSQSSPAGLLRRSVPIPGWNLIVAFVTIILQ